MSFLKNIFQKLIKRKWLVAVVLVILLFFVFGGKKNDQKETFTVTSGDFIKSVSVSGKVVAKESVDMSFDVSGTVGAVYKKVGDVAEKGEAIVALDSSKLQAERQKAVASLLSEQAELNKLKAGSNDSTEVLTNRRLVVNSILDAYTKADDAVRNKVDQFFDDGRTTNPEIKYTFANYFSTKDKINDGRELVEAMLVKWQKDISGLSVENYTEDKLTTAYENLILVKKFLDDVSFAVNSFEESSVLTLTMIDKYRGDVATARFNINTSVSDLASISDDLREALSNVPVYEAQVLSAKAEVARVDAEIAKTVIRAPFKGIVSIQDGKVGEAISANTKIVAVISGDYEIEVFVPEVSIPGLVLNNKVNISLDAYNGEAPLVGEVIHIDPAQTERDGVANYKVKVALSSQESFVRPGMTADVFIEKERRSGVFSIPLKFLVPNTSSVLVLKDKKEQETRTIILGEKDGRGNVEVLSGLESGEKIVLPEVK